MTAPSILARLKRIAQEKEEAAGRGGIHPVSHQHGPLEWFSCLDFLKIGGAWQHSLWYNDDEGSTHFVSASMEELGEVC